MATLHLHVGAPKSGSTYLQHALHANADALAATGTLVPGRRLDHFRLCAVTLEQHDLMPRPRRVRAGAQELVEETVQWLDQQDDRAAVISHELFAGATDAQVRRLQERFDGVTIRVVYVVRALSRTLPAEWQQAVKGGSPMRLGDFVDGVVQRFGTRWEDQPALVGEQQVVDKFVALHDVAQVLDRWAERLGSDQVTVVTMPGSGSDPTELWRRFLDATDLAAGLPDGAFPVPDDVRPNVSLDAVDAEVLRRVNALRASRASTAVSPDGPSGAVRRLAHQLVESQVAPVRIDLPERAHGWVQEQSELIAAHLRSTACRVVGDPAELQAADPAAGPCPEELSHERLADAAVRAVAGLLGDEQDATTPTRDGPGWAARGQPLR